MRMLQSPVTTPYQSSSFFTPSPTLVFLLESFGLKKVEFSDHQTSPSVWIESYYKLEYAKERKCKAEGKGWNQNSRLRVANSAEQPINVWRPPTSSKCLRGRKNSQHSRANSSNIIIPPISDERCYGTTLSQWVSWKDDTRNKERWEICSSKPIRTALKTVQINDKMKHLKGKMSSNWRLFLIGNWRPQR